eukprot:TRINITY_DN94013_c0_g1_i1.p1 TRINITY_DN94013_c0_g1~~TRINITY_DN94013_c0_g1_i1.p1  ORF type:complete len:320 (+),score=26.55 TRINITY_DN94013_c0_g1_i1:48-1007(+)
MAPPINLDEPRWDQSVYSGRAKHFLGVCNPLNVFVGRAKLEESKAIVENYKKTGQLPQGKTEDDIWAAKNLMDSAFHPDSGELMMVPGRMSFQVWGNMTIVGGMLTFYRSTPAVIFWQWLNQSFNALVNYTNRNAKTEVSTRQLASAYVLATSASIATAVGLNKVISRSRFSGGLLGRFVPLVAVWAANCANIPLMRQMELRNGIAIEDETGKELGTSRTAAMHAVTQVAMSRCFMATPGCTIPPVLMSRFEQMAFLRNAPWLNMPLQAVLCGMCLTFATPLCCAIFEQKASLPVTKLEKEHQSLLKQGINKVFFNKGL